MKITPKILSCVMAASALVRSTPAEACSEEPPVTEVLGTTPLNDAVDVSVEAPFVFHLAGDEVPFLAVEALPFTMQSADGSPVAGSLSLQTFSGPGNSGLLVFQPDEPLSPHTEYHVSLSLEDPWTGEPVEEARRYTTGAGPSRADRLSLRSVVGEIRVEQRMGDCIDDEEGFDSCGGCFEREVLGEDEVFRATATLARDGQSQALIARTGLGVSAEEANAVRDRAAYLIVPPGSEVLLFTPPAARSVWGAATACAAVEVADLDGRTVTSDVRCVDIPEWNTPAPETPDDPPAVDPDEAPAPAASDDASGGGCQAAPGRATDPLLLLPLLLGVFRRRVSRPVCSRARRG